MQVNERLLPESRPFSLFFLAMEEAAGISRDSPTLWQGLCRVGIKSPSFLKIPQARKERKAERHAKVNKFPPLLQVVEFRFLEVSSDTLWLYLGSPNSCPVCYRHGKQHNPFLFPASFAT